MVRVASSRFGRLVLWGLVVTLVLVVFRRAWVCDDAFISLRTVDQFVNGRGLVWNTGFRVQAYTHPLWLFVVSAFYAPIRQPFVSLVLPSILATAVASYLVAFRIARSIPQAALAMAMLLASRAFVDFGTSGLENPLLHVGIALVVLGLDAPAEVRSRRAALAAGLLAVTRNDAILLVGPALLVCVAGDLRDPSTRRRGTKAIAIAVLPVLLWTIFSLIYYGAPFPNTAYAKLFSHQGLAVELARSRRYALAHLYAEPFTLFVPLSAFALAGLDRDRVTRSLAAGIGLHVTYLVVVGGDFMLGRFLTPAVFSTAALWARSAAVPASIVRLAPVFLIVGLGAASEWSAPTRQALNGVDTFGIADERDHWGPDMQLAAFRNGATVPRGPSVDSARAKAESAPARGIAEIYHTAGFSGFYGGPRNHVVDIFGLSEGFVARLPAMREVEPRTGHNLRWVDDRLASSFQSILDGGPFRCDLEDAAACALLRDTILAEHAPLFDRERWRAIVRLNTGYHRHRIDVERYRRPLLVTADASTLAVAPADGAPWNRSPARVFRDGGILVRFPSGTRADGVAFSADANDCLAMTFRSQGRDLGTIDVQPRTSAGLVRRTRSLPAGLAGRAFDAILVEPTCGDGAYSLAYLAPITRSSSRRSSSTPR